ncbi:MAG TPA: glycosyl transferase family protein [Methylomirabilota bacterium]|nr:glycosyl transferase family protein [Methylomirabilota bacterium]
MEIIEPIFLALAYVAAVGFLISGLDDLFFDCNFLLYLWRRRREPRLTLEDLNRSQEQWIAIFVPAWNEGGIVNKMAEYADRVVHYEKYDIFIGVYPNDPETNRCVDEICATRPRIHKVMVPHPGPTSKADCLNAIYRGMRLHEVPGVREYRLIALHDAEDVIHPLALKVYNHHVPARYDMAQLPVFALELPPWRYWTGNTYVDDFAELHSKDMFIRESVGGVVPSAGVGTAFARAMLDQLAAENGGDPFRVGNLTEDYEVGIRARRAGFRTGFVSQTVERIVRRTRPDGSPGPLRTVREIVAIREVFPSTLATAVRQRTRWILGISFQTWQQTGWAGTLPMRYTLLRDRRAPLTHVINMIGYVTLAYVVFQWFFWQSAWATKLYLRPVFTADAVLWKVVIIDTWLLVYRALQKVISVWSIYNWRQALFSVPRVVVNNLINFLATARAVRLFVAHRWWGTPLAWAKTTHTFPGEAQLAEYTRTIEDLLVEQGLATREQIFEALSRQRNTSAPLALLRLGLLQEHDFTAVWSRHSGLPVRFINPYLIPSELLARLPEAWSMSDEAVPVERMGDRVVMAFREPPDERTLAQFRGLYGAEIEKVLAQPSHLAFARTRAYPRLVLGGGHVVTLPEAFKQSAAPDAAVLMEAMSSRQGGRVSLPDVMVDVQALTEEEARTRWAGALKLPASTLRDAEVDREAWLRAGPFFWWLHRLLPVRENQVLAGTFVHPQARAWLEERLGGARSWWAELPRKVEFARKNAGLEVDPDTLLLEALADAGVLNEEQVRRVQSARSLITDPVPRWLLLQNMADEQQLHRAFLELCLLPRAGAIDEDEARRVAPLLPPGFAAEHGCFALAEAAGAVCLGLSQMPSPRGIDQLHDRLAGAALLFQALDLERAARLKRIAGS